MAETPKLYQRRRRINYAFIDSQNLNLGVRAQGWRVDWARFKSHLQSQFKVTKAFLFIGYIEEQEEMYKQLRQMGFTLVFKPTIIQGEQVKGNVDVELVLHVMTEWPKYHQAVIISGDGDFYSLVKYLHEQKKLAGLIIPNKLRYSQLYADIPQKYLSFMNDLRSQLAYKHAPHKKPEPAEK